MKKTVVGACIGLVVGSVLGITILSPNIQKHAATKTVVSERALNPENKDTPAALPNLTIRGNTISWRTTSPYPSDRPQVLNMAKTFGRSLAALSNDQMILPAVSAKDVLKAPDVFNAIASGRIDAVFATAEIGLHVEPALFLYDALPFGPNRQNYLNWLFAGNGQKHLQDLFARHNIHAQICGFLPAQSAGFFDEELKSLDDVDALRIRPNSQLAAKVWQKAGAEIINIPAQNVTGALEQGTLDAVNFSSPALDAKTSYGTYAPVYYYPGWHNQGQPLLLLITNKAWRTLDNQRRRIIESACREQSSLSFALASKTEFAGLSALTEQGVRLAKMPTFVLDHLNNAWSNVLAQELRGKPELVNIWQDLQNFLRTEQAWHDMGYKLPIAQKNTPNTFE